MDSSPAIDAGCLLEGQCRSGVEDEQLYVRCGDVPAGLPRLALKVLTRLEGATRLTQVLEGTGLSRARGQAIIHKLMALGVIEAVGAPPRQAGPFSELEQEFFAAELGPVDEADLPVPRLAERVRALFARLRFCGLRLSSSDRPASSAARQKGCC